MKGIVFLGERQVELVYLPRSFVVGAWVSGLAWIAVLGVIAVGARRWTARA